MRNYFLIIWCTVAILFCNAQNFFVSYLSPADTKTFEQYQMSKQIYQTIVWEMSGDVDPIISPNNSMFKAIKDSNPTGNLMTYWTNWGIYTANRAIPTDPYFIPGSVDVANGGTVETNADFDHKMQYVDSVGYSFLQIAPDGTIFFSDPWSDLSPNDTWCQNGINVTCSYQYTSQGKAYAANFGNFEAFAKYSNERVITKYLSIGGAGGPGNNSFGVVLGNPTTTQKFITTTLALLKQYNLNGVDLNYEIPFNDTQALQYYQFIEAIDTAFKGTPYKISISTAIGYANSLYNYYAAISNLSSVSRINMETYEFWGAAFGVSLTGLFENIFPVNAPQAGTISVEFFMNKILSENLQLSKVAFGLGDYGRAVGGIDVTTGLLNPSSGLANTGLYAKFATGATVPAGDYDAFNCSTALPATSEPQCSGAFSNRYIFSNLNGASFTVVDWTNNEFNLPNATTAYTDVYIPPSQTNYSITVVNSSASIGIQITSITNGSATVGQLNYQAPNTTATYDNYSNPSIGAIEDQSNLVLSYSTWQGSYTCPAFNLTQNRTININPGSSPSCVIR